MPYEAMRRYAALWVVAYVKRGRSTALPERSSMQRGCPWLTREGGPCGAQDGMAAIPEEWIAQTARYSEVAALVERLVYEDEPEGVVTEESMASNFIKE